jgi:para-nitrobenzyl esterase
MKTLGLILSATLAAASTPALAEPVKLKTAQGVLVGDATERANIFKAVPYAAPPVGALRWAPPQPAKPWKGERPAAANGPSCMQVMNADGSPNGGSANGPMSEDCLQLNVFAPKSGKKAPVMVWIHGGSYREGAGWVYDGQNFARDGVVLVAINYRLGPLGTFAHPALTKAAGPKAPLGNYAVMDQIAALQWVKKNIAAFGGDPANVTVFGESAGGGATLQLLATPQARGLFARAVVQSGGGWGEARTLAEKEAEGVKAAQALGLSAQATPAELRALPAEKLVALPGGSGPFVDGRLVVQSPARAFAAGRELDVPLIIGANSGEDSLMARGLDAKAAAAALSEPLKAAYAAEAQAGDERLVRAAMGDRAFVAPARWIAAQAADGAPSWLYHFSYVGSRFRPMGITTAAHAAEIQYVFEYWGRRTPLSMVAADDKAMATLMHSCWVAFARTGTPACASGPAWPAYDKAKDQLMEFGAESGVRAQFRKAQLDAQEAEAGPR